MNKLSIIGLAAVLTLAACNGGKDDSADTGTDTDTDADTDADTDTTTDTETDSDTDTDTDTDTETGWTLEGAAIDLGAEAPVVDGTCVSLLDPTPVLSGGSAEVLGETTSASGAFTIGPVSTSSTLGLLMNVSNCDDTANDPYPTNTGILTADYSGLGDGDTLSGKTAYSLSRAVMDGIDASATGAGYTGTVSTDGLMVGFVLDAAGVPVEGATISCGGCTVYYFDADPSNGLFTSNAGPNTGTAAAAKSMFAIPAASITSYTPDDGGTHTWNATVVGSNPGSATIVAFYAN